MNREKYNDPTAEQAIAKVMREEKKKKKKKVVMQSEYFSKDERRLPGGRQKH